MSVLSYTTDCCFEIYSFHKLVTGIDIKSFKYDYLNTASIKSSFYFLYLFLFVVRKGWSFVSCEGEEMGGGGGSHFEKLRIFSSLPPKFILAF